MSGSMRRLLTVFAVLITGGIGASVHAQEFWDNPDRMTGDVATAKDHDSALASCEKVPAMGADDRVTRLAHSTLYRTTADCRRGRYVKQACRVFAVASGSGECLGTFYAGESILQETNRDHIEHFLANEQGDAADLFRKALRRAKPEQGEAYWSEGIKGPIYILDTKRGFYVFSMY